MTTPVLRLDEQLPTTTPTDDDAVGTMFCERGWLPLTAVDVDATVSGLAASVIVRQSFVNPLDEAIEATYIHPLPDRAAVTRFAVTIGDRRIDGVLRERGEARATYDQAIADGRRAAIAEEERPDVFTTRVGNLQPGERADVELTLAQPLPWVEGATGFRFPMVVAPRYISGRPIDGVPVGEGTALDTDAVPDASRISPPVLVAGYPNPVRLGLRVTFADGLPGEVRSSLHGTVTDASTVALQPGERLDRDVVLRWDVGAEDASTAAATLSADRAPEETTGDDASEGANERGHDGVGGLDGDGTFTFTLHPPASTGQSRPRDVAIVLDRSGSMGGWKMVAARRAAARLVDSLTPGDRFTVLAFDNVVERPPRLGDGLIEATDRNQWLAVEWLATLDARGGTEMVGPLTEATRLLVADAAERDAVCLVVTDGQVGNEDQLLASLAPHLGQLSVFTIGIDRAVNAGLLNRLASAGRGRCELVESEDQLDDVLTSVHHRIAPPVLHSVELEADGGTIDDLSGGADCFGGVPLVVRGRFSGPVSALRWSGTDRNGATVSGTVDARAVDDPAAVPLWARSRIRDLEDRYAVISIGGRGHHPGHGAAPGTASPDALADEIVALSLRSGVLSRFTAFVAVDRSERVDSSDPRPVVQPVEQPSGWANVAGVAPMAMAAPAPGAPPMAMGGAGVAMAVAPMEAAEAPAPGSASSPGDRGAGFGRRRADRAASNRTPSPDPSGERAELLTRLEALLGRIESGETGRRVRRELRKVRDALERAGATPDLVSALSDLHDALDGGGDTADALAGARSRVRIELGRLSAGAAPIAGPAPPRRPRSGGRSAFWR